MGLIMDINNPLIQPSSPAYQEYLAAQQNAAQSSAQNTIAAMQKQNEPKPKAVDKYAPQQGFYTYNKHTADDKSGLWDVYTDAWKKIKGYRDEQGVIDYLKAQPAGTKLKQLSRWEHAPETQHQRQTYVNYFLDNDGNLMYQLEKPNYILKPDEGNGWGRALDTFIAFVDPIGTTIRGTYDAIQNSDWSSALHQISTAAPAIDYGLSNVGTWANDISGGQSGQFMDIAAPIVAGLIGTVYGGPFGGAAGATIGKSIAGRWSKDYRGQSEEDIQKGTAITGALSAASAGVGSYLSGLDTFGNSMALAGGGTNVPVSAATQAISGTGDAVASLGAGGSGGMETVGWNDILGGAYDTGKGFLSEYGSDILKLGSKLALKGLAPTAASLIAQPSGGGYSPSVAQPQSFAQTIQNATYPQAQATQGQVPLEGYSKFNRALTPYNLRKKKKLIEDDLYPYIA